MITKLYKFLNLEKYMVKVSAAILTDNKKRAKRLAKRFKKADYIQFDIIDKNVTGIYKNAFSGAANDFTIEKKFEMQAWEYLVYEK